MTSAMAIGGTHEDKAPRRKGNGISIDPVHSPPGINPEYFREVVAVFPDGRASLVSRCMKGRPRRDMSPMDDIQDITVV